MALSDEQIEILTDRYLMDLYQDLEQEVIQDIARRVRKTERLTETAEIMAKSMAEQGYDPSEIYSEVMKSLNANKAYQELIAENTREYKREVMEKIKETEKEAEAAGNKLIAEAGNMSFNDDLQMWQQAKQDLPRTDGMKQIVEGFQKQTAGELRNLTRTTGFKGSQLGTVKVQNAYQRSLDLATLKMCSGTFSYDQACNDSIKQLAQSGLRSINYASGRTYQLDTAVRMCVRTAGSQLAGKITEDNCNKTGQDLVITSQHIGARPSHLNFENKIFSLSGKSKKYPAFSDPIEAGGAGYGEVAGIKGVNCRHDFFPFWEGISKIPKTIEQPEPKWYQGREYNYYDATQKQRAMEREIRALKREKYCASSASEVLQLNAQIRAKRKEYFAFSDAMGISPKENRLLLSGERSKWAELKQNVPQLQLKSTRSQLNKSVDAALKCLRDNPDVTRDELTKLFPAKTKIGVNPLTNKPVFVLDKDMSYFIKKHVLDGSLKERDLKNIGDIFDYDLAATEVDKNGNVKGQMFIKKSSDRKGYLDGIVKEYENGEEIFHYQYRNIVNAKRLIEKKRKSGLVLDDKLPK